MILLASVAGAAEVARQIGFGRFAGSDPPHDMASRTFFQDRLSAVTERLGKWEQMVEGSVPHARHDASRDSHAEGLGATGVEVDRHAAIAERPWRSVWSPCRDACER